MSHKELESSEVQFTMQYRDSEGNEQVEKCTLTGTEFLSFAMYLSTIKVSDLNTRNVKAVYKLHCTCRDLCKEITSI